MSLGPQIKEDSGKKTYNQTLFGSGANGYFR